MDMMVFLKLMARAYPLQKKHLCRQVLAIAFQILKRMKRMREGVQVRKSPTTHKGGKEKRESPGAGLKAHLRSTGRKSNGAKQPQPGLDMLEPPLGQYEPGFIDAEIRRLRVENPKRSLGWIAKQVGCSQTYAGKVLEAAP